MNGLLSPFAVCATCEILPAFDALSVGTVPVRRDHSVYGRADDLPPTDCRLGCRQRRCARGVVGWRQTSPVDDVRVGRSACPDADAVARADRHTLLERYGMTETGMILSNPLHGERRPGFVGNPMPGVEVQLVDESGRLVGEGAPGEIEVRGPLVFLEHWGRAADTAAAFREGWFRTGDMAVRENGAYRLLGRTTVDIIKTGGFKVSALEIEDVLRSHPAVAECAVVGVADEEWGERVAAAIELASERGVVASRTAAVGQDRLAPHEAPRAMRTVDALPRNAVGKVVKPEVAALFPK